MVEINFGSSTSAAADVEVVSSLFSAAMGIIEAMERIRNRMMVAHAIVKAGDDRRRIIFTIVEVVLFCLCVLCFIVVLRPFISTWKLPRRI
jgi:RNase P/RNase MRP subunit POP5